MKILHIIKSLGRGGAETLLPETLKLHNQKDFDFHYIYFLPWKNQMVSALETNGGKVTCISSRNNLELLFKANQVAEYVRNNKIKLIHAHLPWAGIVARIVGRMTGVPVLYTEHNKQERYHFITRFFNLITMNWLSLVIPVSADVEASIRKYKSNLSIPIQTVLNGVNVVHFAPDNSGSMDIRTSLGIPEHAPVVGTIAVFRFQKRLDIWLEIARQILDQVPDAHFLIIGDGPLKESLIEKRASLGLNDRVHFAGLQTEVRPYLSALDVYMMSSVFEGLPIALLEAMSSGCAVVTTNAGGIKEVIRDPVDGFLCDINKPFELVDLTVQVLRNPNLRQKLSVQARNRVIESFSMSKMVAELEMIYKSFLNSAPNPKTLNKK